MRWIAMLVLLVLAAAPAFAADAKPVDAYTAAERAIALARAAHDDGALIAALEDRARELTRQRRGADALVPALEAVDRVRARGPHSRELATALGVAARAQREAGDFGAAIDALEESLAILRGEARPDQREIAATLLTLGQTQKFSGNHKQAALSYAQALAADRLDPDPQQRTRAAILHGMANLERALEHPEKALALYRQAEPVFKRSYGASSLELSHVLNNHANAEANLRHYDKAIALYQRALVIVRAQESDDPGNWLPLANIAMVRVWQGRFAEAEPGFREMLTHLGKTSAGGEVSSLFSRMGLASSLWGQGKFDAAFTAAAAAERVRQSALQLAASHLGERDAMNLQEIQYPTLDLAVSIAVASGKSAHIERAWELEMAARAQITAIRALRLASARAATDPRQTQLWEQWRQASAAFANIELAAADADARLAAQAKLDRAERALALANPLATALASTPIAFANLREHLPDGQSLLLFTTSQLRVPTDFAKEGVYSAHTPNVVYAFLLASKKADVRALRLGPADAIDAKIEAWSAALSDPGVALASVAARGMAVRAAIWQPVHDAGAGAHWLVLPTASLHRVPWAALPDLAGQQNDSKPGAGYLADRGFHAHVLGHERELLASPARADAPRLLAVADPAVGTMRADLRRCMRIPPALPGARRESAALEALWHARYGTAAAATVLVGADASEARLRDAISSADVIHFGTHSISFDNDCNAADPALAATRGFTLAADTPLDTDTPALAPAALLLAPGSANDSDDDGVLSAEEIAALDLSHTRWAVLAACATASGSAHRYEGQFGLARAFRLAGVRTVLTSLWPVDDDATAQWMRALYAARIEQGLDTAASLVAAQRSVLAARRAGGDSTHPYYWAAFVASGDWR